MEETEKKLWMRVDRYVPFLKFAPFLRMVAVCNSLSFGKITEKSDIDLFVVAQSNRLFTVRLFCILILHILGVRAHGKKFAGRFCLSFFVDDSYLDLSRIAISNDIYLAFWVKSLVPILDDGISANFMHDNHWAKSYFEPDTVFELNTSKMLERTSMFRRLLEYFLNSRFGDFLESNFRRWQIGRASGKMTNFGDSASIIVQNNVLKFHHNDKRSHYRDLWLKKFGSREKLTREKFLAL